MKTNKQVLKWILALLVVITSISYCSREDEKDSINRKEEKSGNTILFGEGVPEHKIGSIGDFYFDKHTSNLYGPKMDKGWGTPFRLKGISGENGKNEAKLLSGSIVPDVSIGAVGDWYIDLLNKRLYGPKTDKGWGKGIVLMQGGSKGDFLLSEDGHTLREWLNKDVSHLDMESHPDLKKVKIIGATAFDKSSLSQVTFPQGLEKIEDKAFYNNKLTSIEIPNGVTSIGHYAFFRNKLVAVVIPETVTSIGYFAFGGNNLGEIKIKATTPPDIRNSNGDIENYIYLIAGDKGVIYVPKGSVAAYKQKWGEYPYKEW